jgi:hypothetical protein
MLSVLDVIVYVKTDLGDNHEIRLTDFVFISASGKNLSKSDARGYLVDDATFKIDPGYKSRRNGLFKIIKILIRFDKSIVEEILKLNKEQGGKYKELEEAFNYPSCEKTIYRTHDVKLVFGGRILGPLGRYVESMQAKFILFSFLPGLVVLFLGVLGVPWTNDPSLFPALTWGQFIGYVPVGLLVLYLTFSYIAGGKRKEPKKVRDKADGE